MPRPPLAKTPTWPEDIVAMKAWGILNFFPLIFTVTPPGLRTLPFPPRVGQPEGPPYALGLKSARGVGEPLSESATSIASSVETRVVRALRTALAGTLYSALTARTASVFALRPAFVRALKGDAQSVRRLEELSPEFPEAGFLAGYLDADDKESYLREGMGSFQTTVLSVVPELGISDTPYGKYLAAKRLQTEGEDWIPRMIDAAAAGSEDAVADLMPVQNRKDVRKGLSSASLARGDAAGLVRYYDGEDTTYLDRYCAGSPARTIEVGRLMGGTREIDWLKRGCMEGVPECRDELVSLASSEDRRCKQLVYALHDVGAEMDAAKLYFDMYGDRSLPSVKWLAKVCADEDAKRFVRSKFEEMGDMTTFESIFVDDGYERRDRKKSVRRR